MHREMSGFAFQYQILNFNVPLPDRKMSNSISQASGVFLASDTCFEICTILYKQRHFGMWVNWHLPLSLVSEWVISEI